MLDTKTLTLPSGKTLLLRRMLPGEVLSKQDFFFSPLYRDVKPTTSIGMTVGRADSTCGLYYWAPIEIDPVLDVLGV